MPDGAPPRRERRLAAVAACAAAGLGACGVTLSAAAAHRGGGDLATTAGLFCMIHAAAALALASLGIANTRSPTLFTMASLVLIVGTVCFAADLALAGFGGWHPVPMAAPAGGVLMIIGWIIAIVAGLREAVASL